MDKQEKGERDMSIHVHFVNPNTDEETTKIAEELLLHAAVKKISELSF